MDSKEIKKYINRRIAYYEKEIECMQDGIKKLEEKKLSEMRYKDEECLDILVWISREEEKKMRHL